MRDGVLGRPVRARRARMGEPLEGVPSPGACRWALDRPAVDRHAPPDERTVVVDPGRAFGTGAHPTTRACIELLARRRARKPARCGLWLRGRRCRGRAARIRVPSSPSISTRSQSRWPRPTARANGVEVDVRRADVLRDELPGTAVVVANIELGVVEQLLGRAGCDGRRHVGLPRLRNAAPLRAGSASIGWSSRAGQQTSSSRTALS